LSGPPDAVWCNEFVRLERARARKATVRETSSWGVARAPSEGERRFRLWLDRSVSGSEQVRPELEALVESVNEAAAAARVDDAH
jgi:hypothetical protein